MSAPAGSSAAEVKSAAERRMSLGKYVKRMSSVFKKEKPSKSGGSTAAGPAPVAASSSAVDKQKEAEAAPAV